MLAHAKALPGDVAPGAGALPASLLAASLIFCSPVRAPVTCCASLSGGSRRSGGMGSPSSLSSPSSSRDAAPVSRAHDLGSAASAAAASSPSRFTLLLPVVGGTRGQNPPVKGCPGRRAAASCRHPARPPSRPPLPSPRCSPSKAPLLHFLSTPRPLGKKCCSGRFAWRMVASPRPIQAAPNFPPQFGLLPTLP